MIRVFLASPGDLAIERRGFKDQIDLLNIGFGDGAGVEFVALGWEDTLSTVGRRSQAVINEEIDRCDVFVLTMHRRWGQPAEDAKPYSSYTEEEFHRAFDRFKKTKSPEIFVFFKHVDTASMADPGEQLAKVLKFRCELEASRIVHYRFFADEEAFKAEIDKHLRRYAKGEVPAVDPAREAIVLPIEYVKRVEEAEAKAAREAERAEALHKKAEATNARAQELALSLAREAAKAALEGRVEEARQDFAKAIEGTTDPRILHLAYQFYKRTGDLCAGEQSMQRWLAISGRDNETLDTAAALNNLGELYRIRGALDKAEELYSRALTINEKFNRPENMAHQYNNLGIVYRKRGDLDRAESMHNRALMINEKLGRIDEMACNYGNISNIYRAQGKLDAAEDMLKKALDIYDKLGRLEGMAGVYQNLGIVYQARGDLDAAEAMYKKSLAIDEKLARLEGLASASGNLGNVYQARGDLDAAEEMYKQSLAINERLGRFEGAALQYGNIGVVYETRGDLIAARDHWTKARDLYAKIGMPQMVENVQSWLDGLP